MEVKSPHASVRLEQHFDSRSLKRAKIEPVVEFKLSGAQVVLDSSQADGFLARILPKDGLIVPFELARLVV